jgi:hypothetical protein
MTIAFNKDQEGVEVTITGGTTEEINRAKAYSVCFEDGHAVAASVCFIGMMTHESFDDYVKEQRLEIEK